MYVADLANVFYLVAVLAFVVAFMILNTAFYWLEPSINVSVVSVHVDESTVIMSVRIVNNGGSDKLVDAFIDVNGTMCRAVSFYDAGSTQLLHTPITIPPKSNTTLIISFRCPRPLQGQRTTMIDLVLNLVFERAETVHVRETAPIMR